MISVIDSPPTGGEQGGIPPPTLERPKVVPPSHSPPLRGRPKAVPPYWDGGGWVKEGREGRGEKGEEGKEERKEKRREKRGKKEEI